jgi:hypothetical protein
LKGGNIPNKEDLSQKYAHLHGTAYMTTIIVVLMRMVDDDDSAKDDSIHCHNVVIKTLSFILKVQDLISTQSILLNLS